MSELQSPEKVPSRRLALEEVPQYSLYAARALSAMAPSAGKTPKAIAQGFLAGPITREDMRATLDAIDDPDMLDTAMRVLRREVMTSIIVRDLTGNADFKEVVGTVTTLAEETVSAAVRVHSRILAQRFGVPVGISGQKQDLMVVGMGKLGGEELNVSSDIDLIFVYDEGGETQAVDEFASARRSIANHEFFDKLARRVIASINELDGTGFVFRVDMRLRPFGESGPLVLSSAMLEEYLYSEGRDWERFAWLKGRVVNRSVLSPEDVFSQAVRNLNSLVRPFVFRKYVDFGAISALARIHEMIRAETARKEAVRDQGINIKLGSGGIREIEFICQTFQIIRGGREPELRDKTTCPMLRACVESGCITDETASRLAEDYVFLRNLEHCLQYVDDKQTQVLPKDDEGRGRIARMMGMTLTDLDAKVAGIRAFVSSTFDGVFHTKTPADTASHWPAGWSTGDESLESVLAETLSSGGFSEAQRLAARILKMMRSRYLNARTQQAREQLTRFVPKIAAKAPEWARLREGSVTADEVLDRYLKILETVLGRATYIALLNQYPEAADRVGRMLAVSRWAADYIADHPLVLDELVDARNIVIDDYTSVDRSGWLEELRGQMRAADGDKERQLNLLRDAHHSALFALLTADLEGRLTVERLADQLSALADAVLTLVIELAWDSIASRHCEYPKFAAIGYGKLGGKELGYASDLDLIFLYDDPAPESEGNYAKLVKRMLSWLTLQTSSGILFEVDMRLRPNGQNGLIVSNMDMFRRYQRNQDGHGAWAWEHQALTRARFCAGDTQVGEEFEKERRYILTLPRDAAQTAADVIDMRRKMLEGHPNPTDQFDVKHDRGGMVDLEFIVQYLVLVKSREYPELVNNFGTIHLTEMAGDLGLVDPEKAAAALKAYRRYRNIQRSIRMARGQDVRCRVAPEQVAEERQAVLALWREVFGTDAPQPA